MSARGRLPATPLARTAYRGPYESLGSAFSEFKTWLAGKGHVAARDFWEVYLVGPEANSSPGMPPTELNQPLLK
jgi:effector-binding domain-containing protein